MRGMFDCDEIKLLLDTFQQDQEVVNTNVMQMKDAKGGVSKCLLWMPKVAFARLSRKMVNKINKSCFVVANMAKQVKHMLQKTSKTWKAHEQSSNSPIQKNICKGGITLVVRSS